MGYVESIKDLPDLRVPNREAFKMKRVYKVKLDNFIDYYDYEGAIEDQDNVFDVLDAF